MAPALSRELVNVLSSPQTTIGQAADAIEEHVLHRRSKGDSLSEVSSSLSSIEARSPRLAPAIRQAQYATNVPPSDMTVPPASLANASSNPASVLAFLISQPTPAVQNSRKVILEYVLNREARLREKKYGNGGKGTLGRDGFEEIGARLREIEDGLRGTGPLASPGAEPLSDDELDEARQTSRALILSLRMLLSYFTLPELARQLLCQHPTDAERTLVQHIRRRVAGEGRYNVGRELEYVESLTLNRRPALRPAFRSARARNYLPNKALYPISLPAPSKSACIKLLSAFIREIEVVGPAAASSYMNSPPLSTQEFQSSSARDNGSNHHRGGWKGMSGSASPPSPGALSKASYTRPPHDPSPVENYSLELLSEYITREKREYMLKNKWVKTGREQLGKDLADMEMALCVIAKAYPGPQAPTLMPVFLQIRRTFALPPSPLPTKVIEPFQDMLPSPPDPDSVALREPTVSSTTATLYVNPRLRDDEALEAIEELLENEREKGLNASVSDEKTIAWLNGLVDQVSKRFPDGSYETVFDQARYLASHPRVWPDASTSSAFPGHPLVNAEAMGHRRSQSTVTSPEKRHMPRRSGGSSPRSPGMGHMRSASMPMRSSVHSNSSRGSARAPSARTDVSPAHAAADVYGGLASSRPSSPSLDEHGEENLTSDGESDSLDSEFERRVAPFPQGKINNSDLSALGIAQPSTITRNKPPMLSLDTPGPELSLNLEHDPIDPPADATSPASSYGNDGWWNVVSPTGSGSQTQSPGQPGATWRDSATSRSSMGAKASALESQTTQVPPTRLPQPSQLAEVAQAGQFTQSPMEMSNPPVPPPKPQLGLTPPGAGRDGNMTPTSGSPNPSHSSNSPVTPQLGQSPITPQMGKRTPETEHDATPRPPPIPPQNPRRAKTILPVKASGMSVSPASSAATNEALAKLEGVQLHDESLAKLEGSGGSGQKQIATPVASKPPKASKKASPPSATSPTAPAPPKRQATPEDDLYARLDFIPMDYNPMHKAPAARPAGPIWPNKPGENDRPRRANTQGPNQAPSKGAVWPRRKQSDAGINTADVTSGNGPKSAPLSGPKTSWPSQSSQEVSAAEVYDTLGKRPGVNAPAPPRKSVEGSHQDANAGTGAGAGAAGGDAGQSSVKSKINTLIGRGLSRRDKENGERAAIAAQAHAAVQAQVQAQQANAMAARTRTSGPGSNGPIANNPGKWNRDMVAGIMGPPAARRSS